MLIMLKLYFLMLPAVNGFLLDTPQGNGGPSTTNQYLTLSKFYEEMKFQQEEVHRDTTKLRHDTDNSLALLTTQLQQKFNLLDKKLAEIEGQNKTFPEILSLEQKYLNLEQNYHTLQLENNLLLSKKDQMENELFLLRNETIHQGQELGMLKNKSSLLEQNIEELKTWRSIKPLQEHKTLQQEVKSNSAQTSSLNMKEHAHSQDVLTLYSQVQELGVNMTRSATNLDIKMKTLQMNFVDIESKLDEATITENQTFTHLQQQIDKSMDLVAITAQSSYNRTKPGVINFDKVRFSVGINNLSVFKSTGKFICETGGLYLVSASIMSDTNGAFYKIFHNTYPISKTRIAYYSQQRQGTTMYHTGTIVLAIQLLPNDSVWVFNSGTFNIDYGDWSTLTIAKIK